MTAIIAVKVTVGSRAGVRVTSRERVSVNVTLNVRVQSGEVEVLVKAGVLVMVGLHVVVGALVEVLVCI